MWCGVVTIFPQMFEALMQYGITSRAIQQGLVSLEFENPRDFANDAHKTVDDRPYGGGPGMVMKPEPLYEALQSLRRKAPEATKPRVIYLSPMGQKLTQAKVKSLMSEPALILLSGRYEGVDQRLIDHEVDEMISIGDYVTSGGELPAMVLMDALIRLKPGALGHALSSEQDSFSGDKGILDCPHYTRPETFMEHKVPEVLLSGDHQAIAKWREAEALNLTAKYRPDLLKD